jgi:ElaB/YqjD/DUF883 family membrane-anchored ribosome-binding protein
VEDVRSRARSSLRAARTRLAEAEEDARAQMRAVAASADDYVHHNPWRTVFIAMSLGLLFGLLMSRR